MKNATTNTLTGAKITATDPLTWERTSQGSSQCPTCGAFGKRHIAGWVARHVNH
jgi:hypothetical protein